jgi:hypothetical protein
VALSNAKLLTLFQGVGAWFTGDSPLAEFDLDAARFTYRGQNYADFDAWWTAVGGTYTRSGTRRYINASKQLAVASANEWPNEYDIRTGYLIGKGVWDAISTTRHTFGRDFTNAAWTKTDVTAAKDQTGIDAGANEASSLEATAANGTCLQAVTDATSRARGFDVFVKRLVGTGAIEMTLNGGSTWTAITTSLSTTDWYRAHLASAANFANPSIGFRIVTSGDKIAVDYASLVDTTAGSPPILAGETTSGDDATIMLTSLPDFNFTEGTVAVKAVSQSPGAGTWVLSIDAGTSEELIRFQKSSNGGTSYQVTDGGASQAGSSINASGKPDFQYLDSIWLGLRYATGNFRPGTEGELGTADVSGTMPTPDRIRIGKRATGDTRLGGAISGLRIFRKALSDTAMPTAIAGPHPFVTWGDSLSAGTAASVNWKSWIWLLRRRSASFLGSGVIRGVGSTTSTQALAAMQADTTFRGWYNLIWTVHNDSPGIVPATSKANLAAMAALVPNYLIGTVLRGPTSVNDTDSHAADKAEVNAWIIANYPDRYVDLNQAVLDNGGDALYADTIHLNDAGQIVVFNAWKTKMNALGW